MSMIYAKSLRADMILKGEPEQSEMPGFKR